MFNSSTSFTSSKDSVFDFFGSDSKKLLDEATSTLNSLFKQTEEDLAEAFRSTKNTTTVVENDVLTIKTDLPGVEKKNIKVSFENCGTSRTRYRVFAKREEQVYDYKFTLPYAVDASKAIAQVKRGVLTVTVPLLKANEPEVVDVKIS